MNHVFGSGKLSTACDIIDIELKVCMDYDWIRIFTICYFMAEFWDLSWTALTIADLYRVGYQVFWKNSTLIILIMLLTPLFPKNSNLDFLEKIVVIWMKILTNYNGTSKKWKQRLSEAGWNALEG